MPVIELEIQTVSFGIMGWCKVDLTALWKYIIVVHFVQVAVCFVDLKKEKANLSCAVLC